MSAGEIGVAALWKPISFVLGVIFSLIAALWAMITSRIRKNEETSSATQADLNKNYYDKDETVKMIMLHTSPLKEAIDRQTAALEKLCDKLDKH